MASLGRALPMGLRSAARREPKGLVQSLLERDNVEFIGEFRHWFEKQGRRFVDRLGCPTNEMDFPVT